MKIVYLECDVDELKANRGILDAVVDACNGILGSFYGNNYHAPTDEEIREYEKQTEEDEATE